MLHKFSFNTLGRSIVVVSVMALQLFGYVATSTIAQAGVCTTVTFTKDGKAVSQSGSVSVPANDKSKYQIKVSVKNKTHTACKDTHVRVGVIYIDQNNKKNPVSYILPATKIPTSGLDKTFNFASTDKQGIYSYSVESYTIVGSDIATPSGSVNSEGLRVTLGQAGSADVGSGNNTDYKAPVVDGYKGQDWNSNLSILNPISSNGKPVTDIAQIAVKVINLLLLLIGVVATIMIIYAGALLVFNAGNESRVKQAKTIITWAVIGLVVALSAFALVTIVQSIV